MRTVAVIGLGSRGLSVLERLVTLAREPVRVEVVDPSCSGGGVHGLYIVLAGKIKLGRRTADGAERLNLRPRELAVL